MLQRYNLEDDIAFQPKEDKARSLSSRRFKHSPGFQRLGQRITRKSLAAAPVNSFQSVLTRDQLLQCADAYTNNGIVRTVIDKSVFFIQGERTNFVIEPNDELTEGATDQEIRKLEEQIQNSPDIKELRRKLIRINKRVKLHDRLDKLLTSTFLFGRNALEIVRLPPVEGETFGEPYALRHLNSLRFVNVEVNKQSGVFEGFYYDETMGLNTRFIPSSTLIPAFYDDNNLYDYTNYSGLSAVWPILSVSQTDDVINDEDMPEAVKNLAGALTLIYAGTNSQSKIDEITTLLSDKRALVHGLEGLKAQVESISGNILQLPDIRLADAKYICMCLSLPLFLLFEDTANFATANQVMQVYKAGMLKRHRTWLQGILEDYWYDPILADHLKIDLNQVIGADIKIKAVFPDINFETRLDIVTADEKLVSMGVLNEVDVAKDIDRKDKVQELEQEMAAKDAARQQAIQDSVNQTRLENQQLKAQMGAMSQNMNNLHNQNQNQQASAAASIKEDKSEVTRLRMEKMKVLQNINSLIDKMHQSVD